MYVKKGYVQSPSTCFCENRKYLATAMYNSAVMCNKVIGSFEEERNFNEKKATCKTKNFDILLEFLLITIA